MNKVLFEVNAGGSRTVMVYTADGNLDKDTNVIISTKVDLAAPRTKHLEINLTVEAMNKLACEWLKAYGLAEATPSDILDEIFDAGY